MIVISDTSAVSNLAAINQLVLLKQLYDTVIIPDAVYKELVSSPALTSGEEIDEYDWIQVCSVSDRAVVEEYLEKLDIGESEAIALALEKNADLLLLDEKDARKLAKQKGLKRTGVLGVLAEAKERGLIGEVRPLIETLRNQADFWLSEALCNRVLSDAGEQSL